MQAPVNRNPTELTPERRAVFEKYFPKKGRAKEANGSEQYFTISDIKDLANPPEGIAGFMQERAELLGPVETLKSGLKGYLARNAKNFLEVWSGEEGERWRKEKEDFED